MPTLNSYLSLYKDSHQNPLNIKIHFICVPAIMWSLLGFLDTFSILSPPLHLSYLVSLLGILYYAKMGDVKVFGSMALVTLVMLASFGFTPYLREVSVAVFVLAWLGQFYGHIVEGKKPSFFQDLVFLLIGPVWILKKLFPANFKNT